MTSSRDAAGTGPQAGLLPGVWLWGVKSDFPYLSLLATSVLGQAPAVLFLQSQPGGAGAAFRLYGLISPKRSGSEKHKDQKKSWCGAAFGGFPCRRGTEEIRPLPGMPPTQPGPPAPLSPCRFPFLRICPRHRVLSCSFMLPLACAGVNEAAARHPQNQHGHKSQLLSHSQAATSCVGRTWTIHQVNASHMPLFAKLQDFFYRHCALVFMTGSDF